MCGCWEEGRSTSIRPCGAIEIGSTEWCETGARGDTPRSCERSRLSDRGVAGELMAVSAETDVEDDGSGGIELDEDEIVEEADENVSTRADVPMGRPRGTEEVGSTVGGEACAEVVEGASSAAGAGEDDEGNAASASEVLAEDSDGASDDLSAEAARADGSAGSAADAGEAAFGAGEAGFDSGVSAGSEGSKASSGEAGAGEATSLSTGIRTFSLALSDCPISTISMAAEASTEPFFFFLLAFLDEADLRPDGSGLVGSEGAADEAVPLAFIFCRMRLSVGRARTWNCSAPGSFRSIKATKSFSASSSCSQAR